MLHLRDILLPGIKAEKALRRLVARRLRMHKLYSPGMGLEDYPEPGLAPLPSNNPLGVVEFGIVEEGLSFQYSDGELNGFSFSFDIVLPWAEVRPLLRPNSPVARMLRERGLWRPVP